jgi:hypothetical protein
MRFVADRILSVLGYSASSGFIAMCRRLKKSHFSRTRKMPLPKLLFSILHRRGTTLSIELRRFMELTNSKITISKSSYLQQRYKLAPKALMALCDFHNASLYREEEMQTFKDYLILASDGSGVNVPTTKETLKEYGTSCSKDVKQQASLGLSCLYDVINKVILCCSINRVKFNEAEQVRLHLKGLSAIIGDIKTIVTLDRGFPSLPLFSSWLSTDQKFVVRLKDTDFKAERSSMKSDDEWVDIAITKNRLAHYKGTEMYDVLAQIGSIRMRIVNIQLDGGALASVATNLDESKFSTNDISHLYSLRWGIETAFDMLKNQLEIENFTGTKPVLIEQDIFACVYLCNIVQDMIADAQANLDSKHVEQAEPEKSEGKYKMVINKAYAVGVMKDEFIKIVLEPDIEKKRDKMLNMVEEIQKHLLPVRPGRHFERHKGNLAGKFSNTRKRCY